MGDLSHEPSMEEILSSIKKIIAEDGDRPASGPRLRRTPPAEAATPVAEPVAANDTDVLELTEALQEADQPPPDKAPLVQTSPVAVATTEQPTPAPKAEVVPMKPIDDSLLAEKSATASRNALAQLSAAKPAPKAATATDTVLEALVVEALRPLIKDWLDANLPRVVEKMVAKEIARLREE